MRTAKSCGRTGRPTKYGPEVRDTACKLAEMFGATNEQIAKILHVAGSTLGLWLAGHQDFSDALKEAKEGFDSGRVVNAVLRGALGYYYQIQIFRPQSGEIVTLWKYQHPSLGAQVFWLANRQRERWRSIKGGPAELPVVDDDPQMTDQEAAGLRRIAEAYLEQQHQTRLRLTDGSRA